MATFRINCCSILLPPPVPGVCSNVEKTEKPKRKTAKKDTGALSGTMNPAMGDRSPARKEKEVYIPEEEQEDKEIDAGGG
jgi:hypothetical protein